MGPSDSLLHELEISVWTACLSLLDACLGAALMGGFCHYGGGSQCEQMGKRNVADVEENHMQQPLHRGGKGSSPGSCSHSYQLL